jgi:glutamine cyclotransferase
VLIWLFLFGAQAPAPRPVIYTYTVVNTYPHDAGAYTQGLVYRDGFLYESTGLTGRSSLRKVKLETGEVVQRETIDRRYFAEGLAEWKGKLAQLTWQSGIGFLYDRSTLTLTGTFKYAGEGWGLTHDGKQLILSDGTETLRFLDPQTFTETGRVAVMDGRLPVRGLNELEYVQGEVFANVWHSDRVARIAPATGLVAGWIEMKGLLPEVYRLDPEAVLNGIAYDAERDRLFVTGKLWPKLFEIKVSRRKGREAQATCTVRLAGGSGRGCARRASD